MRPGQCSEVISRDYKIMYSSGLFTKDILTLMSWGATLVDESVIDMVAKEATFIRTTFDSNKDRLKIFEKYGMYIDHSLDSSENDLTNYRR